MPGKRDVLIYQCMRKSKVVVPAYQIPSRKQDSSISRRMRYLEHDYDSSYRWNAK